MTLAVLHLAVLDLAVLDLAVLVMALFVALALGLALVALGLHVHAVWTDARRARRWARWEPALLDALQDDRDPASLYLLARPRERTDFLRLLVAYALRLDGDSRETLRHAAAPVLGEGLRLLAHRRPDQRAFGIHLVGVLGTERDRARLVPLLADRSPGVAMLAARALAHAHMAQTLPHVLDATERFQSWDVASLASMLVQFGLDAIPWLLGALTDAGRSETARCASAEALRRLGSVRGADAADALLGQPDIPREVAAAALRLLRDAGGPAHAAIARACCDDPDEVIRMHAVSALAAVSLRPEDAARIEYALSDPSPWVARRAARGLVESGRLPSLLALAEGDGDRALLARQALAEAGRA
jgi:hypothetical protein